MFSNKPTLQQIYRCGPIGPLSKSFGLWIKLSPYKDKLKGTLIEDLKVIEEMSDKECRKTLFEFLMLKNAREHIQDHINENFTRPKIE